MAIASKEYFTVQLIGGPKDGCHVTALRPLGTALVFPRKLESGELQRDSYAFTAIDEVAMTAKATFVEMRKAE